MLGHALLCIHSTYTLSSTPLSDVSLPSQPVDQPVDQPQTQYTVMVQGLSNIGKARKSLKGFVPVPTDLQF